jgi:SulP family sulfate permease
VHWPSLVLGLFTIFLIGLLRKLNPKLPTPLIGMVAASALVGLLALDQKGVTTIGQIPRSFPPLARLPLLDLDLIRQLSTGALAMAALGLVEAISITRSIASQTGQRLDSNQEFVGQGLANIACGLFSGYPCSGSFIRSAVNHASGGKTPVASISSGIFVLIAMIALAPLGAFVPRAALAGVLILAAFGMINHKEIVRIWHGARGDAVIMLVTFLATLLLPLEFAILSGLLISFAVYILKTSVPRVSAVLPDDDFQHFAHRSGKPQCPQLGIIEIFGDLYFGAVSHIEQAIYQHLTENPDQRYLLLRLRSVHHCDISGIHALEGIVRTCRDRGGDLFVQRAQEPVVGLMQSIGFSDQLGVDHFLPEDAAISHLFYHVLDPAMCIYECPVRVFKECQNLPKRSYPVDLPLYSGIHVQEVITVSSQRLWQQLHEDTPPLIIDVREPREFRTGHIPQAESIPLPTLLSDTQALPRDRPIVLVCRSGRRSTRATAALRERDFDNISILQGGMLSWEAAGLLDALGD